MAKVLTDAAVKSYKPGPKRRVLKDGGATSLYLVIQPSGHKSWLMRFRRKGGKPAKLVLGPLDLSGKEQKEAPEIGAPHTLAAARHSATRVLQDHKRGADVFAEHKATRSRQRTESEDLAANAFGKLVVEYVREWKTKRDTRTRRWRGDATILGLRWPVGCEDPAKVEPDIIKGGLADTWRDKPIADIDRRQIFEVVDKARKHGIPGLGKRNENASENRARKMHAALSVFFRWALEQWKVEANPCVGVKKPKAPKARERKLNEKNDNEIRWFWQATGDLGSPFGPLLRLLLITGQRLGEVSGMRRDELQKDEWHLPGERTKNHRHHIVPLCPLARELIDSVPKFEGCPYVFSTGKKSVSGWRPVSGWSKTKKRLDASMTALAEKEGATIEPWTLHDLRRTAASGMQRLGERAEAIERALNHVSGVYAGVGGTYKRDPLTEEVRAALARWAEHVHGLGSDKPSNVVDIKKRRRR